MKKASDEIKIGSLVLKNRITMAPTVKFDYAGADGKVTDKHVKHYETRAKGGAGLICVEATAVTPDGRFGENHMGLYEDSQIEGHKRITEAVHKYGAAVIIQLNHTGYVSNPLIGKPVGPSTIEKTGYDGKPYTTQGFTLSELHNMQKAFVDAAMRAKAAGYDGVQLHGCHGYLINQFVNPDNNKREDEYGGNAKNRARFAFEIISEIKEKAGKDFLVSVRTTGHDNSIEDAISVAEEYIKAGCDYLQVSHGISDLSDVEMIDGKLDRLPSLGVYFKKHFGDRIPVSCVGGLNTPEIVNYLFENDYVDTVDLGRTVLADPDFPKAVIEGTDYVKCFSCRACQFGPFQKHVCPANLKKGIETV